MSSTVVILVCAIGAVGLSGCLAIALGRAAARGDQDLGRQRREARAIALTVTTCRQTELRQRVWRPIGGAPGRVRSAAVPLGLFGPER